MTIRHERVKFPPRGLAGGRPGRAGRDFINGQIIPAKGRYILKPGDVVSFETPGGGGLRPPAERERSRIDDDVASGVVTAEAAGRDYGPPPAAEAADD